MTNITNITGVENTGFVPDVGASGGTNYEGSGGGNVAAAQAVQAKAALVAKSLAHLVPGHVFSSEILDIQPGVISLQMGEGGPLVARTLAQPDARIGDNATFVVRENVPGQGGAPAQIVLEFLRGSAAGETGQVPASIVKEALSAANMQYTGQNSALIEQLVAHNLPIDPQTVQRAAFFKYSMPDAPFPRIAFLLENNFAPIERTVEVFQRLSGGEMNLKNETANLQKLISEATFQNPATKESLQAMLSGKLIFEPQPQAQPQQVSLQAQTQPSPQALPQPQVTVQPQVLVQPQVQAQIPAQELPQAQVQPQAPLQGQLPLQAPPPPQMQSGQTAEPQSAQTASLGKYLTELRALTEEVAAFLRQNGENNPAIRQSLENISDVLDFARNIGETKMYYQFPFVLAGKEQQAELHVFKRKAARKTSGKNATALIGLDMAHLGRIEVLVNKNGRDVNLQFRADTARAIILASDNKVKLADMLGDKGYLLTGLGLKMIDEKFDITRGHETQVPGNLPPVETDAGAKRYSFDMRV